MKRAVFLTLFIVSAPIVYCGDKFDPDQVDFKAIVVHASQAAASLKIAQASPPQSKAERDALASAEASKNAIVDIANKYPKNPVAAQTAGEALSGLKDYTRAAPLAERAVGLAVDTGDDKALNIALLLRGDVHYGKKEYAAALADAAVVLKRDPGNKAALELKYASAGRADGGRWWGRGAAKPRPNQSSKNPSPHSAVPDATAPAAVLTQTIERQRSDALLRDAEARMRIDSAAARELLDKAVHADPKNAQAYYARASARWANGDLNGADADLKQAVTLRPNFAEAHLARASLGIAMGKSAEEIKAEFLKSGKSESDFSAYYGDVVAKLAAQNSAFAPGPTTTTKGSTRDFWVSSVQSLHSFRNHQKRLSLLILELVVFAVAAFYAFKRIRL